ncbi:hypothetical protein V8E53_013027 [Lactarius tabidus]
MSGCAEKCSPTSAVVTKILFEITYPSLKFLHQFLTPKIRMDHCATCDDVSGQLLPGPFRGKLALSRGIACDGGMKSEIVCLLILGTREREVLLVLTPRRPLRALLAQLTFNEVEPSWDACPQLSSDGSPRHKPNILDIFPTPSCNTLDDYGIDHTPPRRMRVYPANRHQIVRDVALNEHRTGHRYPIPLPHPMHLPLATAAHQTTITPNLAGMRVEESLTVAGWPTLRRKDGRHIVEVVPRQLIGVGLN